MVQGSEFRVYLGLDTDDVLDVTERDLKVAQEEDKQWEKLVSGPRGGGRQQGCRARRSVVAGDVCALSPQWDGGEEHERQIATEGLSVGWSVRMAACARRV